MMVRAMVKFRFVSSYMYIISLFILATGSIGQLKWQKDSESAPIFESQFE